MKFRLTDRARGAASFWVPLRTIQRRQLQCGAVSALRANINMESPRAQIQAISFDTLVEHYRLKEMGEDAGKTFATCETYEGYLRKWILPRWKSYRLRDGENRLQWRSGSNRFHS